MFDSMFHLQIPPLTDDEREVVEDNINLVWNALHKWKWSFPPYIYELDDIFSIGVLSLVKAVKTYDPKKAKISTWVTQVINTQFTLLYRYCNSRIDILNCDDIDEIANISDETQDVVNDVLDNIYLENLVKQAGLSNQEREILHLVVGKEVPQKNVAERIGTSQSNISRIKNKALRKLKKVAKVA